MFLLMSALFPIRTHKMAARWAAAPLAVALATGATVATTAVVAPVAVAHDRLIEATPGDGETLTESPAKVTLRYSAQLLPTGKAAIQIKDASGAQFPVTSLTVAGDTISGDVETPLSGDYTLVWRVVSSDGHPITGDYTFTVTPAEGAATPTADEQTSDKTSQEALPTETAGVEAQSGEKTSTMAPVTEAAGGQTPATSEPSSSNALPILGGAAAVLAAGTAIVMVLLRRRQSSTPS